MQRDGCQPKSAASTKLLGRKSDQSLGDVFDTHCRSYATQIFFFGSDRDDWAKEGKSVTVGGSLLESLLAVDIACDAASFFFGA